jgi:glutathione S-transferase
MITLNVFGPMFGLPDPSPFVTKTEVMFKMCGVPYTTKTGGMPQAPKGKMPYIEDKGVKIGDSTLIRLHLEKHYGADFDKQLSPADKGIAWAIEKMLEDNLYWALVYERWTKDDNFNKGPKNFFAGIPAPLRAIIVSIVRRKVRKNLFAHGMGRHTDAEIVAMANRNLDALAATLGDKPYLMGASACGADATAFAFASGILCPLFNSEIRKHAESHPNLVAYSKRLHREFYGDKA